MNQIVDALLATLLLRAVGMIDEAGDNEAAFDIVVAKRPLSLSERRLLSQP